jgi:hypothetical protein
MNREESKKYCVKLLKSFIEEKLNGDINNICKFDLAKLDKDDKFGKPKDYPNNWVMDPDDSIISRAVLYLLFYDEIEEFTFDKIGDTYRGDTLFTPGNLLGKAEDLEKQNQYTFWKHINNMSKDEKAQLQNKIVMFLDNYHTFSNMTLFPNCKIIVERMLYGKTTEKLESINNYRGMNDPGFSDYVDIFLNELEKCIIHKGTDEYLKELFTKNSFYFDRYEKDFQKFCNSHFLQVFYVDGNVNNGLKDEYKYQHYVRWMKLNNPPISYSDEIDKYISGFDEMRKFREDKIIKKLEQILK